MKEPCTECGSYKYHYPLCSLNTPEQIKQHLIFYFEQYKTFSNQRSITNLRYQERVNRSRKEAEFWKGKFMTVKAENNKLRKR